MRILNFGSLNYDYVYRVNHAVRPGETVASYGMETFCGGKGLNQSVALSRTGIQVYHAGLVGEDGQQLLDTCTKNKVDTTFIKMIGGKSGHTIIQVDDTAQNCILLYGGCNRKITKEYIDEVLTYFEKNDIILLQNEINELPYIMERASEIGMTIVLNPSPYDENLAGCDLNKISIFLLNEIEGSQITGMTNPEGILTRMLEKFPLSKIILTLGEKGVIYQDKDQRCRQSIFKVKAVDTTAAGDTFTGYFIYSLIKKIPVKESLALSSKAAAIAVSRKGAIDSIPYLEEVEN